MKTASRIFMKLPCSFALFVIIPMVAKTEIFMSANEIPTDKNSNLKYQNSSANGTMLQIAATIARAISMAFLSPIFGKKEAKTKDVIAIGMSLKPSRMAAESLAIPKFCCTCNITRPTLFSKIANTK